MTNPADLASALGVSIFVCILMGYSIYSMRKQANIAAERVIKKIVEGGVIRHYSNCSMDVTQQERDHTLSFSDDASRNRYIAQRMIKERQHCLSHGYLLTDRPNPADFLTELALEEWDNRRGYCRIERHEAARLIRLYL